MTTYLTTDDIPAVADLLRGGGLAAVPTETVYGLAADATNPAAVARVFEVKGRPEQKALSVLVPGPGAIDKYCRDVPAGACALAERFWPGPLTLVLPSRRLECEAVRSGGETLGLRCPDHPLTLALLEALDFPLAAPSANPSGRESPKTAGEVLSYFEGQIEAVLDGGPCGLGRESTVFDMSQVPYRVLRQGALPEADVAQCLRESLTVVGLTGGSGSGKTTALRVLEDLGALILDADRVYHELTVSSAPMREELTARFGPVYTGSVLDRKALAAVVFSDPAALLDLNRITHKYVQAEIEARLRSHAMAGGTLAAIDAIGLLDIDAGRQTSFNVAVTAPLEDRVARLTRRDGIPAEAARARIAAQHSDDWFREKCDYTLHNGGDRAAFEQQCISFFTEVLHTNDRPKQDQ